MIPVKDSIRARRWPVVTLLLMGLNILIFVWTLGFSTRELMLWNRSFGMTPIFFQEGQPWGWHGMFPVWGTMLTSQFLHGSWSHLLGNMLYLWIFGDNVEDHLGRGRFLLVYLLSGVAGNLVQLWSEPYSTVTVIGASGAIAAVLGAYLVIYPRSRVYTFIPIGFFARLRLVPAVVVLTLWFILQLFSGVGSLGMGDQAGTAYWAHIGGFVFGLLVGLLFKKSGREPQPAPPSWN